VIVVSEAVVAADAERERRELLVVELQKELVAERQQRKIILGLCAVLGATSDITGLCLLVTGDLAVGTMLTFSGIAFLVLALAFRSLKIKVGLFEIEAER